MAWILFVILQAIFIAAGVRNEQRAGLWSWSKFAFALGFAALEVTILIGPIVFMNVKSPRFMPVFIAAWVVAALNFIWMILVARRWKLPDGHISLQAYRNGQKDK
jgi:hypothetical protein